MKKISSSSILYFLTGLVFVAFILLKNPGMFDFQNIEKSRSLYKTAREYQRNGEYKDAFYTYSQISQGYKAYDSVLFHQAKCATDLQDEKTVVIKLSSLLSDYPTSPLASQASYNLGQAYIRMNNYAKAEKQFEKTINNYPKTNFALGSYYYLGQINKDKNKKESEKFWLKYLEEAPSGRFALDCYEGLKKISHKFSAEEKKNVGIALYAAEKYSGSIFYLKQLPLKDSWYYLAKDYEATGRRDSVLYFYKEGLKKSSSAQEKKENFESAMQAYASASSKGIDRGWDEVLTFAGTSRDYALFHKAQLMPKNKRLKYYWEIISKHPDGSFASDALWNIFWDALRNKKDNYASAIKFGNLHISKYQNTKASPAIYFWMGKIYEKKGERAKAIEFYKKVIAIFPDSYYAFRADGRIGAIRTGFDTGWTTNVHNLIAENRVEINPPLYDREIASKYGSQAVELINVGDYETLQSFIKDDPFLESWIYYQNNIISKSIVTARNRMDALSVKPKLSNSVWKLIYPVYFAELINKNSRLNNLDPAIVLSLIKEESYFNTFALSYSNARGLMQLLPGTANDIARWKKLGSFSSIELFDPEINIKLGASYLRHTKSLLYNNMLFAVAAYNAGPQAVNRWTKYDYGDDLDIFVENIPYEQTRTYVKKVFKSYWNYKRIYALK